MIEPEGKKLSYSELVEIFCKLAVRLDHVENVVVAYIEQFKVQDEFYVDELLKLGIDSLHRDKRTPFKRLMEVETRLDQIENKSTYTIDLLKEKRGGNSAF